MVQYLYTPAEIAVQDRRRVSQSDPGANVAQQLRPITGNGRSDMLTNLAGEIAGLSKNFAAQAFNIGIEKAYADGAAEAGIAESEDALNSNPFTRDWKVAGFRDATAKMALADATAQFELDLVRGPNLQEKDPSELKAYLTQRRNALTPVIAKMSGEQRTAAMAKLALLDRTNIAQHNTAYRTFMYDTAAKARMTSLNTRLGSLSLQKANAVLGKDGAEVAFNRQMDEIVAGTLMDVWENPSYTLKEKQALTSTDLEAALATDNIDLYDRYDEAGLTTRLAPEDAVKLANKRREAQVRNQGLWAMQYNQTSAKIQADMDALTYTGSVEDAVQTLNAGLANRAETSSTYQTKYNKIMDWANKMGTNGRLVEAYVTGNATAITRMGKTEADGLNAVAKDLARSNKTVVEKMKTWLDASAFWPGASKELGKLIAQPMSALFSPGQEMLPEHKDALNASLGMVREAERQGNNVLRNDITSSMSDDDRLRFERVYELHSKGIPLQGAVTEVQGREALEKSITPTRRAANSQRLNTELNGMLAEVSSVGAWGRLGLNITSVFSAIDAAKLKISPENNMNSTDGIFRTSETVRFYESQVQQNLAEEIEHQRLVGYDTDATSIFRRSISAVAGRVIKTESGPVILPRGFDAQQVLGTSGGNMEGVGPAIDSIIAKTESASKAGVRFRVQFAQGKIFAQGFDNAGTPLESLYITPEMIRGAMGLKAQKDTKRNDEVYGAGKSVTLGESKVPMVFSGKNSAAVADDWMMEFRENLVQHEGFRDTPYEDLSGNKVDGKPIMTVGVGISSHNKHYPKAGPDGKYTPEALQAAFLGASNDAAIAGRKTMEDVNLKSKSWFNLFAELSYQSGTNFLRQQNHQGMTYRSFVAYAQAGNVEKTLAEFKKTPAYFYSRDPKNPSKETARQKFYLNTIKNAMKGE